MEFLRTELTRERSARALADMALVQAALDGGAYAYEVLLQRYRKPVFHVALKMVRNPADAEDLTMEVFAKAFRYLSRYCPDYAFSTWLFRIATNHCIDFLRRQRLQTHSLQARGEGEKGGQFLDKVRAVELDPQELVIRQQRWELVQRVVNRLPAKYEQLVRLRYFEELHYHEIAVALQLPMGTVKAQLFRARALLFALLKEYQATL